MCEQDEVITRLAEKYLSKTAQDKVEELLLDGERESAKFYILGALETYWKDGRISDEEGVKDYQELGADPTAVLSVRQ
ncbi:hypothetical protein HQ403_00660 [Candidatus Kaiserbacteria bacterium]|nr:hypothetical protein [Candidatus Kaiserbacteria bacterium]